MKSKTASWQHVAFFALAALLASPMLALAQEAAPPPAPPPPDPVAIANDAKAAIDALWVLVAGGLVFFMQAGFLALEVGCVRQKAMAITALKNMGDWCMSTCGFFVLGFGLMFGASTLPWAQGFIGTSSFLGYLDPNGSYMQWIFFMFQLGFLGTAVTIVSGAMAERTTIRSYLIFSFVMGILIYPVFGHWAWGNAFVPNKPWLQQMGYVDFAGSSVVHMCGGMASWVGIAIVGPRLGLFTSDGRRARFASASLAWTAMGVAILWLGWWGFNGGSTLGITGTNTQLVGKIVGNTNTAAAVAGVVAFIHCILFQESRNLAEKALGGMLGGLVAITANCHIMTPQAAVVVGLVAGVVHNVTYDWVLARYDDVVGAIPVHYSCGVWGILAVALLADRKDLPTGSNLHQLWVQSLGVIVCTVWVATVSYITFMLIKSFVVMRVSPLHEIQGHFLGEAEAAAHHEPAAAEVGAGTS
jgi:Amt family ammonium transporter